ncbi:MAG: cobalamin-dependent protein [Clostridia bacterium]|nr:cobalamin-dependent protein [Clostridia bacterium]
MKFLLVKPNPHKNSINLQSFMICEPLELEYAAAVIEQMGHTADVVDLVIDKSFLGALKADNYDVVAFTSYLVHIGVVKEYAEQAKRYNPRLITVVGGVHCEVVPEDLEDANIDVVLSGGLYALGGVIRGIENGEPLENLKRLGRAPKGCDFQFTHPNRAKTAKYRQFYNYIYHDRCATIKTSFSCAYDCDFCFCTRLGKYHERPLDDVISELEEIEEPNVFIVDDNFLSSRTRIREFCRLLDERGIKKTYIAFGRADFIAKNEDMIALLARHGFDAFFVGIESFKTSELGDYNKRTSVDVNNRAVRILERNGLQCYSGLIVGFDWTREDFDGLISYLNTFEHPMVNIQPITPIKGTPFYERMKDKIVEDERRYENFDMAHAVMLPEKMSVRAFYYNIVRAYLKTSASAKGRRYIKERYGKAVYRRVRKGAAKIAMQYFKLILKPNIGR